MTDLRLPVQVVDVQGLGIRAERVDLSLGAHPFEAPLVLLPNLRDALGSWLARSSDSPRLQVNGEPWSIAFFS